MVRILLVDDDENVLFIIKRRIMQQSPTLEIVTCNSAQAALQQLANHPFDAIVADYLMPEINGLELLQQLRYTNNNIPFIILTGQGHEKVAMKALNLGADHYLRKADSVESVASDLIHGIKTILERKDMEEALRRSEERYRHLVETMNDGLGILDEHGQLTYVNKKLCEIVDYSRNEMIGQPIAKFLDDSNWLKLAKQLIRRKKGKRGSYELAWTGKDGRQIPTIMSAVPIVDGKGTPKGSFATITDITKLKLAEQKLQEAHRKLEQKVADRTAELRASEEKYRELVERLHEGITVIDEHGFLVFANPRFRSMLGYSEDALVGQPAIDFVPESQKGKLQKELANCPYGISSTFELCLIAMDGPIIPVIVSTSPLFSSNQLFRGTLAVVTDISNQKQAEEALRASENRYRRLVETMTEGIF